MPKNVQTTTQLLISHASKVMLKILQARLQQYVNHELTDVQAGFRKGRGTIEEPFRNCQYLLDHQKKTREFQKNIYFCFIDYAKAFVWITTNCGKFLKRWEYQNTLPASWEIIFRSRSTMASDPITSWKIDGETVETVTDFIFGGSRITANSDFHDCSHENKRCLLLGRKAMANLDSILKSRDITFWQRSL